MWLTSFTKLNCHNMFLPSSRCFPDVVITVIPCCFYVTCIWARCLPFTLISSYHALMCICLQFIAYLLIISFGYWFMRNPDLTCIVKGWSGRTCIPYGATWRGNWLHLLLRGLLSSYWTNANFSFLCAGSLGDE